MGRIVLSEGGERFSEVMSKMQSPSTLSYSSEEINYHFKNIKVEIPKDIIFSAQTDKDRFLTIRIIDNYKKDGDQVSTKWMLSVFDNSQIYREILSLHQQCEEDVNATFDSEKELLKIFKLLKLSGFS